MKRIVSAAIAAGLFLAAITRPAVARQARNDLGLKADRIDIHYVSPKWASHQPLYKLRKEPQTLERIRNIQRVRLIGAMLTLEYCVVRKLFRLSWIEVA